GSMLTEASPNDPVFWLLHANLDRLWAEWEGVHGYDYPATGAPSGENLHDLMYGFDVTPADVLDPHALGYAYDTEPASPRLPAAPVPGDWKPAVFQPPHESEVTSATLCCCGCCMSCGS